MSVPPRTKVVTLRVSSALHRALWQEARRRRCTKREVVREILERALAARGPAADPAREARRQSLLVSTRASEKETLAFIERAGDRRGWR